MRNAFIWLGLLGAVGTPLGVAASSPLLAWRDPIYVMAGFAGVVALALLLIQPLLAAGALPIPRSRQVHRSVGVVLVFLIIAHVGGLWITSPPDVIDALLFTSATPFAAWGVIAMWAIFATAVLAIMRNRISPRRWRIGHVSLAILIVAGSTIHAMLIEGTMGLWSKAGLCLLVAIATGKVIYDKRIFVRRTPR